jgi:hypothetical protein
MRLTVGPLPAAVYWRRRGVVLVGLAMVVFVAFYALSGPAGNAGTDTAGSGPTPSATVTGTAAGSPAAPASTPSPTPSPTPTAYTLPVTGATGPCTDAEMDISATAPSPDATRGQSVVFTIKIKNISSRTCVRDIGADEQELMIKSVQNTIWSSDDCDANHGHTNQSFTPGYEISYGFTWQGYRSRGGDNAVNCTIGPTLIPVADVYQVVARLDQKYSTPFALRLKD